MQLTNTGRVTSIGIVGSGYTSRGLWVALQKFEDVKVTKVLTRRNLLSCLEYPQQEILTNSVNDLIDNCELIVECSGDVVNATEVIAVAVNNHLPVVTMSSEFHVTTGSYFVTKGIVTEAEGDQPGCLAALRESVLQMGFEPIVYGNAKGFLKHNPTLEEMTYWSNKEGISIQQVISFTDGTKLQIEQALVANGLGAEIAVEGLLGIRADSVVDGALALGKKADEIGAVLSDYVLSPNPLADLFIVAKHDEMHQSCLRHYKMGEGPYYYIPRSYHLCHLEIPRTLKRIIEGGDVLLNNGSAPKVSVAALTKKALYPGDRIKEAIGGFDVRGIAITSSEHPRHIPIGLASNITFKRKVEANQIVTFDDVDVPDSLAVQLWFKIVAKAGEQAHIT
jgi:predicted homoserine dehydrogenase-like protein